MDDTDEEPWESPIGSLDGQDVDFAYETPCTSPDNSPIKFIDLEHRTGHVVEREYDYDSEPDTAELTSALEIDRAEVEDILSSLRTTSKSRRRATPTPHSRWPRCGVASTSRPRVTVSGPKTPSRFVNVRSKMPTKERLLLSKGSPSGRGTMDLSSTISTADPFGPRTRQLTIAVNQFFTVSRQPAPALQSHSLTATDVANRAGLGTIVLPDASRWTVASHPVTEGIASTTNSRGGRVTSGTNAPLYNANMLAHVKHQEDVEVFGRRLAVALDVDLTSKMLMFSDEAQLTPAKIDGGGSAAPGTVWKDGRWHTLKQSGMATTTAPPPKPIPVVPFKILNAPDLRNDFYCSLLAYCPTLNCIAVGLGSNVHLWADRRTRRRSQLCESMLFPTEREHITSISFSSRTGGKSVLAVGRADGGLALWDPSEERPRMSRVLPRPISHVCFRPCHSRRASERDQNILVDSEELLVGTDDGAVTLCSIEWPNQDLWDLFGWASCITLRAKIMCNTQQICGIAWTDDGKSFATGGNDNHLFVFDFDKVQQPVNRQAPLDGLRRGRHVYAGGDTDHPIIKPGQEKCLFTLNAAVKAIAFAPWQSSLLAASGGSNDRCIHFLHVSSGATVATINCHAQVTSLMWNTRRKEIVATLGFAQPDHPYRIVTFAWPSCEQLTSIPWANEERALYAISYPMSGVSQSNNKKNDCLVVATSDHSIKFHEIWHERKSSSRRSTGYAESQILTDTCSEELESEMIIR